MEIFNEIAGKIHRVTLQDDLYCQIVISYFVQSYNETIKLTKMEKNILAEIQKNPHITKNEICDILGIGKGTVARATKNFKDNSIIERIRSTKAGYCGFVKKSV